MIQPFDGARFDKRFADVFSPAIEAAKMEPYRVDRDPGVDCSATIRIPLRVASTPDVTEITNVKRMLPLGC